MKIKGCGEIESANRVKLTIAFLRVDDTDKRKHETVYKNSHYFEPKEYWDVVNKIKFDSFQGPTHASLFGFYSQEEEEEERFWEKKEDACNELEQEED